MQTDYKLVATSRNLVVDMRVDYEDLRALTEALITEDVDFTMAHTVRIQENTFGAEGHRWTELHTLTFTIQPRFEKAFTEIMGQYVPSQGRGLEDMLANPVSMAADLQTPDTGVKSYPISSWGLDD